MALSLCQLEGQEALLLLIEPESCMVVLRSLCALHHTDVSVELHCTDSGSSTFGRCNNGVG